MIYLVGSSKGGVGKSTIAVNLAAWLAMKDGPRVTIVDTDVQRHASDWVHDRHERWPRLPAIDIHHAYGRDVPRILLQLKRQYDLIVVDAGGRDSQELRGALKVVDVLISPVVGALFDLKGARDMAAVLDEAALFRDDLLAFAFLNKVSSNWVLQSEEQRAREALAAWPQTRVLASTLALRRPFAVSVEDGRAAFEMTTRRTDAADEFDTLADEIHHAIEAHHATHAPLSH